MKTPRQLRSGRIRDVFADQSTVIDDDFAPARLALVPRLHIRELHPWLQAGLVRRRLDWLCRPNGGRHRPGRLLCEDHDSCAVDHDCHEKDARDAHELDRPQSRILFRGPCKNAGDHPAKITNIPAKLAVRNLEPLHVSKTWRCDMKTGKTSAATLGLVGGVVLGAWIGAELTTSRANAPEPPAVTTEAVQESPEAAPARPKPATRVNRVARPAAERRRGADAGIDSQTGDDDSGVGARAPRPHEARAGARHQAAARRRRLHERRAVRDDRACGAQHAGAVHPAEASRAGRRPVAGERHSPHRSPKSMRDPKRSARARKRRRISPRCRRIPRRRQRTTIGLSG